MAPVEDLQARDLAWISDFVMQQMVLILRPMMEQLQQTDANCDYTQHTVQRLSMDVSEVRSDLERTNKYLGILRQGLGVQNESRCMMQRGVESATRAVKRLDEQMEGLLDAMRGTESTLGKLSTDARSAGAKHDELARQVGENAHGLEDVQVKVERVFSDVHALKDTILNSEARLEVWQRELRELRRQQLGIISTKTLEEKTSAGPPASSQGCRSLTAGEPSWPQKKNLTAMEVCAGSGKDSSGFGAAAGAGDRGDRSDRGTCGPPLVNGTSQSKRLSRVGSGSKPNSLLTQDHLDYGSSRTSSRSGGKGCAEGGIDIVGDDSLLAGGGLDENASSASSKLPLLSVGSGRQGPGGISSRPSDNGFNEGPRLRFSATMVKPPSRGNPN